MTITNKHIVTRALLAVAMLCLIPFGASARADDEAECYRGEYVLSVSSIPVLRDRAVETFDKAVSGAVDVSKEGLRTVLIETKSADDEPDGGEVVSGKIGNRACEELRRMQRDERRADDHSIVRTVNCSCNSKIEAFLTPNDSKYELEWGLNQPNDIDIDAPEAWDITTGNSNVVVAVIDTGVDYNHPDLQGNIWDNPGEVAGNNIDDDHNGYVDDIHGMNAINGSGNPMDDNGHGTHCSGTIGARTNNSDGVAGVTWNVKIMGIKFLGSGGNGSLYGAIAGMDYVTAMRNRGVNVVLTSNSWGTTDPSAGAFLREAMLRGENAGLLFVAAAGNSTANVDSSSFYPAKVDLYSVVSVAAVDSAGKLASFSNYGATTVDVGAPGVNIASTYPGNSYYYMSGTSMAAPHVSGLLALAAAAAPGADWRTLKDNLMSTTVPLSDLQGKTVTGGMINAQRMIAAVNQLPPPVPTSTPAPTLTPTPTSTPTPIYTATPTPTVAPGNFRLNGQVKVSGVGVGGAAVIVTMNGSKYERTSAADGSYDFGGILGPVDYTISVRASGYYWDSQSGTLVRDTAINFNGLRTNLSITGVVLDVDGRPIQGIAIDGGDLGTMISRADGSFSFDNAYYGMQYRLRARDSALYKFNEPERLGTVYGNVGRVFVGTRDE